jgi:hypothetical protein
MIPESSLFDQSTMHDKTWHLCEKGLKMHPTYQFDHTNGYRAQIYRCPLLFPAQR